MRDLIISRFGDGKPVLISPDHLGEVEACLQSFAREAGKVDGLEARAASAYVWHEQDHWLAKYQPYVVVDGVLQVPVKGVLVHDFAYSFGGWVTGYDYIWNAFKRGMEDSSVRGVALVVDSPGGMVSGCFDAVDKMFELKGSSDKPVQVFVSEMACSAAYAIASVGDSISMTRTSLVGSIGVITMHIDQSQMLENYGVKVTLIHAGEYKADSSPYKPLSEHALARRQAMVDETYDVFVQTVARNRPSLSEQAARDSEADVFTASEATANGFADSIGTIDDQLAEFTASLNPEEGDFAMAEINQADIDAAVAAATTKAHAEGQAAGAAAEKTRIVAILNSDAAKERPNAALAAALETDMSAETALTFLSRLPAEAAQAATTAAEEPKGKSPMLAAMDAAGGVNLSSTDGNADKGEDKIDPAAFARSFGLAAFQSAEKAA